MKEILINNNDEGQRADKFLLKYFNKAPKSFIYKMLRKKRIKLNNTKAEGNEILKLGDKIQMYLGDDTVDSFVEKKEIVKRPFDLDVIYEDKNILVVNKRSGVLSHAQNEDDKDTLIDYILTYLYEKGDYNPDTEKSFVPAICNRLDRNTSGIVVAGKTADALRQINSAIRQKGLGKYYLTVVLGEIKKVGELRDFYEKDGDLNKAVVGSGKSEIVTKYKPLASNGKYTLVEIELITGKSHQIRVHMSSIGHPVLGDSKYGDSASNLTIKKKYNIKNQILHAYKIEFDMLEDDLEYLNKKVFKSNPPADIIKFVQDVFGTGINYCN